MRSYTLVKAGLTSDELPVFKFEAELADGADFDGKFQIQFALVRKDGEERFALNSPQGVLAVFEGLDDSQRIADALAEHGEYIVCADYENRSWEEADGFVTVLMGRDIGQEVDFRQTYELDPEEREVVLEIADRLDNPHPST